MSFTFEAADQDGYSFRAVEAWPSDQPPVRARHEGSSPSAAYGSNSMLTFDDQAESS
ncbi:hypothetical protein [Nocardioides fonticola]|uniref:hypothetical protein n=1 Tax=Nocardioides fonticola TaxID=450363 RepID=UPI0031D88B92